MKRETIGFIFARGGSKGVPGKNIRPLAGVPLIAHAINAARNSRTIDRVVVSTDDTDIAAAARQFGAEVPFIRPAELATDRSPEWLSWQHAVRQCDSLGIDLNEFVCIPATSPLRLPSDIDRCVECLQQTDSADLVLTVSRSNHSPYFNMVSLDDAGWAGLFLEPPSGEVHRRQDAPAAFNITTVAYATRPDYILSSGGLFDGKVRAVEVPVERALDIDTELDFQIAEFLFQQRRNTSTDTAHRRAG